MNFNSRHLAAAIALHVAIFALLFVSAFFTRKVQPPQVIAATIIELPGPQEAPQAAPEEQFAPPEPEPPPPAPEPPKPKPKPPKPDPEKLKKEQEEKAAEEQKRKLRQQEEQKKREELKLKAEAERKRIEEEKKRQQEEARLRKEAEEAQKKALAEEMQRQLDEEKAALAEQQRQRKLAQEKLERERRDAINAAIAAEEAAARRGRQATWGSLMEQRIKKFWTRPPGTPDDFRCFVEMELQPTGAVVGARVTRSCGNPGLDRSVEQAVIKASPMPLPPNPADFVPNIGINFCPRGCQ